MNSVDDATGVFERATLARTELAARPASVDQPAVDVVLSHALSQHLSVATRVEDDEGCTVAGGESRDWLQDTVFGTRSLRGVASQEMIAGLFRSETRDRRKDTKCIAGEHNDVARLAFDDTGDLCIRDVFNGVGAAGVFCDADVIVIGCTGSGIVDNIFEDGAVLDGIIDIRLLLSGEVDALGVAATLNVKDTGVGPDVLVITNEETVGVGRECGLTGPRETEEEGDVIVLLADISRGVEGELTKLDGLKVVLKITTKSDVWNIEIFWRRKRTMTEKTPFFISPAYSVPRMTISMRLKLISTEVVELIPLVKRLAGNWPAL